MKTIISVACLLLVAAVAIEARPKRSVLLAAPAVAVASVPVVRTAIVHDHPTTVVKTEQVHDAHHGSSYSYSTEVKSSPHVHSTVAAAPLVAAAPVATAAVSTIHHTVPTYATYGYYSYPYAYSAYHPYAYSPYSYVLGK